MVMYSSLVVGGPGLRGALVGALTCEARSGSCYFLSLPRCSSTPARANRATAITIEIAAVMESLHLDNTCGATILADEYGTTTSGAFHWGNLTAGCQDQQAEGLRRSARASSSR